MAYTPMRVEKVQAVEVPGLGNKIKQAREADGRALTTICSLMGMSTANWYRIEQEKNETIPEKTLRKIETVLGVDFGVKL